jgi:hypothetical protein
MAALRECGALNGNGRAPKPPSGPMAGERSQVVNATDYLIRDRKGQVLAVHRRIDGPDGRKRFAWLHPDGTTPGLPKNPDTREPLYGAQDLLYRLEALDAVPDAPGGHH